MKQLRAWIFPFFVFSLLRDGLPAQSDGADWMKSNYSLTSAPPKTKINHKTSSQHRLLPRFRSIKEAIASFNWCEFFTLRWVMKFCWDIYRRAELCFNCEKHEKQSSNKMFLAPLTFNLGYFEVQSLSEVAISQPRLGISREPLARGLDQRPKASCKALTRAHRINNIPNWIKFLRHISSDMQSASDNNYLSRKALLSPRVLFFAARNAAFLSLYCRLFRRRLM